jgi:hypothetical protein
MNLYFNKYLNNKYSKNNVDKINWTQDDINKLIEIIITLIKLKKKTKNIYFKNNIENNFKISDETKSALLSPSTVLAATGVIGAAGIGLIPLITASKNKCTDYKKLSTEIEGEIKKKTDQINEYNKKIELIQTEINKKNYTGDINCTNLKEIKEDNNMLKDICTNLDEIKKYELNINNLNIELTLLLKENDKCLSTILDELTNYNKLKKKLETDYTNLISSNLSLLEEIKRLNGILYDAHQELDRIKVKYTNDLLDKIKKNNKL